MTKLLTENGSLNIEDLIMQSESFQKIMADDVITEEEAMEQENRVVAIIKEMEETCTPEQIEILRRLMAEICVLVSVNSVAL